MIDAFKQADQVLLQGVSGHHRPDHHAGLINLDFADVKSVMQGAGSALMGIGSARGEDRARAAAEMAISSPLLEASIDGAHGVLLSISGGSDLGLFEINEAARLVQESAHPGGQHHLRHRHRRRLGDEVRVTVIAAGFDGGRWLVGGRGIRLRSGGNPGSGACPGSGTCPGRRAPRPGAPASGERRRRGRPGRARLPQVTAARRWSTRPWSSASRVSVEPCSSGTNGAAVSTWPSPTATAG
jgi:cell division protein FtsZ